MTCYTYSPTDPTYRIFVMRNGQEVYRSGGRDDDPNGGLWEFMNDNSFELQIGDTIELRPVTK